MKWRWSRGQLVIIALVLLATEVTDATPRLADGLRGNLELVQILAVSDTATPKPTLPFCLQLEPLEGFVGPADERLIRQAVPATDRAAVAYYLVTNHWEEAKDRLEPLLGREPGNVVTRYAMAFVSAQTGDWERAVDELGAARHWKCLYALGKQALEAGTFRRADYVYSVALSRDRSLGWAYYGLGTARLAAGDWEAGLRAFREGVASDPEYLYNYTSVASIFTERGAYELARIWYARALEHAEPESLYNPHLGLGIAELRSGDTSSALKELTLAHHLAPSNGKVMYELGRTHMSLRDVDGAIKWWQQAIAVEPNRPPYRYALASGYATTGRCASAAQEWDWIRKRFDEVVGAPAERYLTALAAGADCRSLVSSAGTVKVRE